MAFDPVKQFLQMGTPEETNAVDVISGNLDSPAPAVTGLGESFARGAQAGAEGLSADVEYFKGLFNLAVGDDEAAAANIRAAEQDQQAAAAATSGMQSFEDFLKEPSVDGFLSQIAKFSGQTSVSAITSIAGGGIGGVIGKAVGKKVASKAAQRIAKDSLERTAKGVATPEERLIAQMSYDYAKRGAFTGAFGAEYVPAAAGGLREAVESDQEIGADTALRSFLVGAPIAAVGTLGEAAILKAFGNVAAKRAIKEGDTFSTLAKDIASSTGRTAAIEGTTEVIQESIAIANRASMDDSFTAQEAALRLGEAAFAGFFSGGALGAAGGAAGNVISRRGDIAEGTGNLAANVVDKARRFLDQGQTQQTDSEINKEQYGDIMSGLTTPESQADINAQLSAMVDETSNKESVWVAGNTPEYNARPNKATEITVNGKLAFAAFIPGRGTIISTNRTAIDQVIQEEASEQSLASALGYSAAKETTAPGDLVVQALDANGSVISEEVTSKDGLEAAFSAARALAPEGGSVKQTTVEKALEERRRRAETEAGPVIREMDITEGDFSDTVFDETQTDQEFELERVESRPFSPKRDPNEIFDNTESLRNDYVEAFGPTDWTDPFYGEMSEALLREAVDQQNGNPTSEVSVIKEDNSYKVVREGLPADSEFDSAAFLAAAVNKAKRSKFARDSRVVIVPPEGRGKPAKINLVDITNAGKRLLRIRGDETFQVGTPLESAKKGLQEILADLQLEGYDILIDGQSLFGIQGALPDSLNVAAARIGKTSVGLKQLLTPVQTVTNQEQRGDGTFDPAADAAIETTDMTEIERMQRSSANLDIPQTGIEQEVSPSFGPDLRLGRAPTTGPATGGGLEAAGFTDPLVRGVIDALLAAVKFVNPPRILTFAQIDTATDAQLEAEFSGKALEAVIEMRDSMRASESKKGTYSGLANVAIIRETSNPLNDALVIGHELGHALFKQEQDGALSQRALRNSLLKAFNRDARRQSYLDKYSNQDLAFEEWYADNVAKWASREYVKRQAASLTDRHFKKIADRLKALYRTLSSNVRKRMGRKIPQEFEQYMDVVTGRVKEEAPNEVPFKAKQLAAEVTEVIVKQNGEALASHWQSKISDLAKNPTLRPIMKLVRTADGVLRSVSRPIADMFYVRSQDASQEGGLGMLGAKSRKLDQLQNDFEDQIGPLSDPQVQAALLEASSSAPTSELSPQAQSVRQFLDKLFDEYIEPSNTNINRQENYFPVVLNLLEIESRPDEFVDFIVANQPGITRERALEAVHYLRKYAESVQDNAPITIDPTDPAAAVEKSIILTKGIDRKLLSDAGFLQEPQDAFVSYMRHIVKRVEWNTHTKDANGVSILDAELDKLSEEDAAIAREIIGTYLGYQSKPLSPLWRKINSYGQFLQFVTILPFATIASIPELAGPIINSKELNMDTFMTAFKQIGATIKNRAEATQFARDLGVTTSEVVANAWVTEAEQDYMDTKVRKMSDRFFSVIGLNFFTKFTREFAAGMGVQFILKHAKNEFNNPRSERYLKELGLTAAEVTAWEKGGRKLTTPEGKRVAKGLQRFVESSILRPNAAERPVWASDPHWALVWQLKSFLYAYTKVITGGVFREALNRRNETKGLEQLTATTAVFFLTAIATMPLAMLALELREYAKYGLAWAIPGLDASDRYFRSDSMDWDQYLAEIFDRSGFVGPLSIGNMALQNAEWGKNPILPILGPTAETIDVILKNGFDVGATLKQRLPI